MKDVYGNKVKDLSNCIIVSNVEAKRLYKEQLEEDKIRVRHYLKPIINYETQNTDSNATNRR
tara:strand:+ start:209 stop:394 length:186 start_codon:yes stop_codon:yes gene_type:complete